MEGGGRAVTHEDVAEQRVAQQRIEYLAHHDALTDLANRLAFNAVVDGIVQEAANGQSTFAMLCMDVDRFKEIDDVFGHPVGDEYLKALSFRLTEATASDAEVGRDAETFRLGVLPAGRGGA